MKVTRFRDGTQGRCDRRREGDRWSSGGPAEEGYRNTRGQKPVSAPAR
jgi:hypothetical protein